MKEKNYKPLVYVCTVFKGEDKTERDKLTSFSKLIYSAGGIPVIPYLLYPYLKYKEEIKKMDMVLLGKCDGVWVLGNKITEEMEALLDVAYRRRQKMRFFTKDFKEVRPYGN